MEDLKLIIQILCKNIEIQQALENQNEDDKKKLNLLGITEETVNTRQVYTDKQKYPITIERECFSCCKNQSECHI